MPAKNAAYEYCKKVISSEVRRSGQIAKKEFKRTGPLLNGGLYFNENSLSSGLARQKKRLKDAPSRQRNRRYKQDA